jgi:hypothetical protein
VEAALRMLRSPKKQPQEVAASTDEHQLTGVSMNTILRS